MGNETPDCCTEASRLNRNYQFDQADDVMLAALKEAPQDRKLLDHFAELAVERSDWHNGVIRAARLRESFPKYFRGYRFGLTSLRELDRLDEVEELLRRSLEHLTKGAWWYQEHAHLAEERGDWTMAARILQVLRDTTPENPQMWVISVRSARRGGQFDLAERLCTQALEKFPQTPDLHISAATLAEDRRDWDEAERLWLKAKELYTGDPGIALRYALVRSKTLLQEARNWDETIARLHQLHQSFPKFMGGYAAHIDVLRRLSEYDRADALTAVVQKTFPADVSITMESAQTAFARGQVEIAIQRLEDGIARAPNVVHLQVALARVLGRTKRYEQGEAICVAAMQRFRFDRGPFFEYAQLAVLREDRAAALERWRDAERRFPADVVIRRGAIMAELALIERGESTQAAEILEKTSGGLSRSKIANIMMQFESLGGPGGACEFGLAQRLLGAEPYGLLRWSSTTIEQLTDALESDFEGVGAPDQTLLELIPDPSGAEEYRTTDRRYGMNMHTFVSKLDMPWDKMFEQSCRRLAFLRRKLIEDLKAGEKIFVYRPGAIIPAQDLVYRLYDAIRRYGDNTTLYVQREDEDHASGTVERVKPGLMFGYIGRFYKASSGEVRLPEVASWASICVKARRLFADANGKSPP